MTQVVDNSPMPSIADQWLGTGLRFPIRPDERADSPTSPAWTWSASRSRPILDTEPGERIMLPDFGCGLRRYLMEPNTLTTRTAMEKDITEALQRWEPRIRLTNVAVTPGDDPSLVWIEIAYVRLSDLRPDNLVYPFYLR